MTAGLGHRRGNPLDDMVDVDRRFRRRLRRHVLTVGAPLASADDVVQEVFFRAWQMRAKYDPALALWPWLKRLARNSVVDLARANAARVQTTPLDDTLFGARPSLTPRPEDGWEARERVAALATAMDKLPARHRRILLASAIDGASHEQIAATLGTTVAAVRSALGRARRTARAEYAIDAGRRGILGWLPLPIARRVSGWLDRFANSRPLTGPAAFYAAAMITSLAIGLVIGEGAIGPIGNAPVGASVIDVAAAAPTSPPVWSAPPTAGRPVRADPQPAPTRTRGVGVSVDRRANGETRGKASAYAGPGAAGGTFDVELDCPERADDSVICSLVSRLPGGPG